VFTDLLLIADDLAPSFAPEIIHKTIYILWKFLINNQKKIMKEGLNISLPEESFLA